ncbi:hypothetical protein TetV_555 [Tetraselmis virus 1]|uniref:Uncharacterized protein n=1 Tax=Tetraselmis virus 1 TaxID=2060617 RepID=A0A2P0VP08_9VIRU|nr:hypothetical protein QJ968_gp499 [Tetraselmis virus 1]AUF82637.1 hypothetical protein TetV_555 [Tetraselmis virus 1]
MTNADKEDELCLICIEKPCQENKSKGVWYPSLCEKGCRGQDMVCEECYKKITKCVYCRRIIRINCNHVCENSEDTQTGMAIILMMFILLMLFYGLVFSHSEMQEDDFMTGIQDSVGSPYIV